MPPITLEAVQAKQTELAAMIQQLTQQAQQGTQITIEGRTIELQAGERYAGAALDADGNHLHHLVVVDQTTTKLPWQDAMDWAKDFGAQLPTRQELALIFANCKPHLKPEWHWSSETHEEDASYAWACDFDGGDQGSLTLKSYEGGAVAVRRV